MTTAPESQAFKLIPPRLRAFLASLRAVLDVEEFVTQNAKELNSVEGAFVREAMGCTPGGSPEIQRKVAEYIHPKIHERMNRLKELDANGGDESERAAVGDAWKEEVREGLAKITGDPDDYSRYAAVWNRSARGAGRAVLMRNSLLISSVSDFEVLVSGLVRAFLEVKPEILRASEQKYSMAELEAFATLDEFKAHSREGMADTLLRGGFEDWMDWFGKRHKLPVAGVTDSPAELVEIFQRRHLLVHNAGVVNKFYLSKVSGGDPPQIGERLRVNHKYLVQAVDSLRLAGIKLSISLLRKLAPDDEQGHVDHQLGSITYDFLSAGSLQAVVDLNEWHLTFVKDEAHLILAKVNRWTALKKMSGIAAIRDEVTAWNTDVLARRYQLAKLALLDMHEEAIALAKALVDGGELSADDWRNWPMLEWARTYEAEHYQEGDRIAPVLFASGHADS